MMRKHLPNLKALWMVSLLVPFLTACGTKPILTVNYHLPAAADTLAGLETSVSFHDERSDRSFLSPNARQELEDFSGIFSLVVSRETDGENLVGAYRTPELIMEILSRRLNHAGMRVVPSNSTAFSIELSLKEFYLDLVNRKWTVSMNYQIRLVRDGKLVTQQTVSGSAERARLSGQNDAEKVVGELVSDMINRIDVNMLAEQMKS